MESELRTMVPGNISPGNSSSVSVALAPVCAASASTSGTATYTRSLFTAAMWNSSCGALPAPALISAPMSVFRAVMTPANGAVDLFERLQLLQPVDICGRGIYRRLLRAEIADRLIGLLPGDGIRLEQVLPANRGRLSQLFVRLRIFQLCASLIQLLIDFRGFDLRQQLTLLDVGADVYIPMLEIAIGTGIDRGVVECLRVSRQHDLLGLGA